MNDISSPLTDEQAAAIFERSRCAQEKLQQYTLSDRVSCLKNLLSEILQQQNDILDRLQEEAGKSRTDALVADVFATCDHVDYLIKNAAKILREPRIPTPLTQLGKKSHIFYGPHGTILVISPWNYPFYLAMVPITTAFVAGNAVVFKPSEYTPLRGLIEKLCEAAGFESDFVQVVYGDGKTAQKLIDQRPDKIFFTGSVATGQKIMQQAGQFPIPVVLELGGKDPMIVFEDAHLERATAGALWGAFTNVGQACTSIETIYVHEAIYEKFKEMFLRRIANITQDIDPDGSADIGRMCTGFQVEKVREQLEDALAKGACQLTGHQWDGTSAKIPPIVLEKVQDDMLVMQEETFGPVVPLKSFQTEDEVLAACQGSRYGLNASVWTADLTRGRRVARKLKTGNVSINDVMATEGNGALPFGGVKDSGFGKSKGAAGLMEFVLQKSVMVAPHNGKIEPHWYPYTPEKFQLLVKMIHCFFRPGIKNFLLFVFYGLRLEALAKRLGKL